MKLSDYSNLVFASSTEEMGNMTLNRGDKETTLKNRQRFLDSLNIDPTKCVAMSLVHETDVLEVKEEMIGKGIFNAEETVECDGLITNKNNVFLFFVTGDCLPIAFCDPKKKAIALVHGSRHNLLKGVITKTLAKFKNLYNSDPKDIVVEIGPSIGPCCYKGDKTKHTKFTEEELQPYLFETDTEFGMDIWQYAEDLLEKSGIPKDNINNQRICTYHTNKYFSHRKFSKENLELDSRFATILGIKND